MTQPTAATPTHALYLLAALALSACNGDNVRADSPDCPANLLPGDLVISEFMADPPGADGGREWFEIYNPSAEEVDLNGSVLRYRKPNGDSEALHEIVQAVIVPPQGYLVLGDSSPEATPDFVDYGYSGELKLGNSSGGEISVICGTNIIDQILYEEVSPDQSRGFDGTRTPDAVGNDDLAAWCDASSEFEPDVFGTPGAANDPCLGDIAPTTCLDQGALRDIVVPVVGDLVITEFMPNPAAVDDGKGEWFEVYVQSDVDLNYLGIGKAPVDGEAETEEVIEVVQCVRATAGTYLIFAREPDMAVNGGLPRVDFEFGFAMSNSNAGLTLLRDGQILDEISWTGTSNGASSNLDPDAFDPVINDDEAFFCESTDAYGDGDLGTPGGPNIACPKVIPEGQCLEGDTLRPIVFPAAGEILITEFMANPNAVGDTEGEWFELLASAAFDLNGLELGRGGSVDEVIAPESGECLSVVAGDISLFVRNPDTATNGGLPQATGVFSFALSNSGADLFVGAKGTVLDEVSWVSTSAGASTSLDPLVTSPTDNDDPANWCDGAKPYGDGDLGTPGTANPSCGTVTDGTCDDAGTPRPIVAPVAGDLVITEFMANPSAVTDANGEWFEVLVTANIDLNGLQYGRDPLDPTPDETLPPGGPCISAATGDRLVFARDTMAAVNGGITPVAGTFSFGLTNGGGTLFVGIAGEALDELTFTSSVAGVSTSVAAGFETPADNIEANFCASTTPYGDGDLGTPGDVNVCG